MRVACTIVAIAVTLGACREPDEPFRDRVAPVLAARCAAAVCHGVTPAERASGVKLPEESFLLDVDDTGNLADLDQAAAALRHIANSVEDPAFSSALRKPLPHAWGGVDHQGGDNFTSPADPGYVAIRDWIEELQTGGEDPPEPVELTPAATFFRDRVQPAVARCAAIGCHDPDVFVPYRLDPGLQDGSGPPRFSHEMTIANYQESRRFLSLDGSPLLSRLVRKSIPTAQGGIPHRAPTDSVFSGPQSAEIADIVEWANMERRERLGDLEPQLEGFIYVTGPVSPRPFADPTAFVAGRDLVFKSSVDGSSAQNLTRDLHDEPADIRDPDASPDAQRVVFSMRRSQADAFRLYELALDSLELTQLTDGPPRNALDVVSADLNPTYGSDGHVYFVSNRHGWRSERGGPDFDIFRVGPDVAEPERLTFTPSPELEPTLFRVGSLQDYLVFSYRRAVDSRDQTVGFSLPLDQHVDYHIYFGITSHAQIVSQFSELPDGRSLAILTQESNVWQAGQLAVIDRNLGPDYPDAALGGYADATARVLDRESGIDGISIGAVYRDPRALADGTFVVARAAGPVDLTGSADAPNFDVVLMRFDEAAIGCDDPGCSALQTISPIADDPLVSEFDPEPIFVWPAGDEIRRGLDADEPTLFSMSDVSVNDAIMAELAPETKRFRDDARYLRFVEARPDLSDVVAEDVGVPQMPSRILGEIELSDDGSVFVEIPPNIPFRTQLLDANRMSVGVQHNRWLFAWPGQHFKQSAPRRLYNQLCAGCHGSRGGPSDDELGGPELTTLATITLSRYADANARQPLSPLVLGDDTRKSVSFVAEVDSILSSRCAVGGCHDVGSAVELAGGEASYRALVPDHVDVDNGRAADSALITALANDSHTNVEVDDSELHALIRWIEVGVPYSPEPR